jgi:hypothetical protein
MSNGSIKVKCPTAFPGGCSKCHLYLGMNGCGFPAFKAGLTGAPPNFGPGIEIKRGINESH